jgi:SAM-dependent methyltransferase
MRNLDDRAFVSREYASLDRLERRRLDRTGWLRESGEPIDTLLAAIAEARPHRVLDAGCGSGALSALVAAPSVVCVDQSAAAVQAARARGLEALQADIEQLPYEDASFDVVMSNWTLYHLPDLNRGLREIARVLRPGGRLVGAYNRTGHLNELWQATNCEPPRNSFEGHNGTEALRRHFLVVERRDTGGEVLWETRDALTAYLDAYTEMLGPLEAPEGPYPFRASRRNCVFVADKAA